jgi:hypothetical protein
MMKYKQTDIQKYINEFQAENGPTDRYSSFDYCYQYFLGQTSSQLLQDTQKSCLMLGFYLASWGMLRGSSFLLEKSVKHYEPLINYIASLNKSIWSIDVDTYTDSNISTICNIYKDIKNLIIENNNAHLILVTKILLGVFGFIPAYDQYFGKTFRGLFSGDCGFRSVNKNSLKYISDFYQHNKKEIDTFSNQIFVIDFSTGKQTNINYPKAKIIDMYGFTKGL